MKIDYRELQRTAAVLEGQIADTNKRAEGRELSASERRTLQTLRDELDAVNERAAEAEAEERAETRRIAETGTMVGGSTTGDPEIDSFRSFIRTGELRASMSYTDANGGVIVPHSIIAAVVDKLKASDPFLARATTFDMSGGNNVLQIPVVSALGATAWAAETGARAEQNSPTFSEIALTAYEVYTDWRASQQFIDSVPDVESWITDEITSTILAAAGTKFAVGTGTAETKGAFANTTSGYTIRLSGAAAALANTAFTSAYADLPAQFLPNAAWVMKSSTFGSVLPMVYPNTQAPLVQFVNGAPTIMGKPVLMCDNAPEIGAANYPVFFGDIEKAYAIGLHRNVTVLSDPYTAAPYRRFYALARIGGTPRDNAAGVLVKSNNA